MYLTNLVKDLPIGKRVGRLKKRLGFGATKVFHSIRKTVITQLEQAGVPESVTADIVGHEKKTIDLWAL